MKDLDTLFLKEYASYKILGFVIIFLSAFFIFADLMQLFRGVSYMYPFLIARVINITTGIVYLKYISSREIKQEYVHDIAPFIVAYIWANTEVVCRILMKSMYHSMPIEAIRLAPVFFMLGAPSVPFIKRSYSLSIMVILFIEFFWLEYYTSAPLYILVSICVGFVFSVSFIEVERNNKVLLLRVIDLYKKFSLLFKETLEEYRFIKKRCLYISSYADAINSPTLVVLNCLEKIQVAVSKLPEQNKESETVQQTLQEIKQHSNALLEFACWLSEIREKNSHLKDSPKSVIETTHLLFEKPSARSKVEAS